MSTVITHKQFANERTWSMDLCGRPLTINMGKVAERATPSALVTYGETTVLVATTVSPRPRDGIDFFPLSVDFEEKLYAVGRIPGSFMRREGQPSLPAVLAGRVIDRSIRPLFPYDFRNDVVCTCTVMSVDRDCSPEVTAMIGVSACLAVSCIPWAGPIGCLEMGYVDGRLVYNPTNEQKHASQLDLTVAATAGKVIMIEAGAKELPDAVMYDAIVKAHEEIQKQVALINQMVSEIGKEKMAYDHAAFDQELFDKIVADFMDEARAAMEAGRMVYAGKYSAPDYELIKTSGCGLALESTMIYHNPEVKEQLERLGVPVLVERSSYESHPLGRMEWVKLYGALLNRELEAETYFRQQLEQLAPILEQENTGKTVAFFYITSNGAVSVRKSGDYIAKAIDLAGGVYALRGLTDEENALSTMNIQMETFYQEAREADVLIYNSAIDANLETIEQLVAKAAPLADFKAVQSGDVWCTGKSMFQESQSVGSLILDIHAILTGEDEGGLVHLHRLV